MFPYSSIPAFSTLNNSSTRHNARSTEWSGEGDNESQLPKLPQGTINFIYTLTEFYRTSHENIFKLNSLICSMMHQLWLTTLNTKQYDMPLPQVFRNDHPDLMIKFGSLTTLAGYPPWPVHLTEIISLPTCLMISPYNFLDSLNRYFKIEKRVGK